MGEAPPSRERHGPAWLVQCAYHYGWEREGDRLGHGTRGGRCRERGRERRPEMSFLAYQHGTWEATLGQQ